ncbi:MAG: hypothetical protein ACLFQE_07930 [Thermotogota bacterium]
MKKIAFSMLVLLVIITASCSVTAGIPWLFGGWGFFVDFGFAASERGTVLDDGFLSLDQDGRSLTGTLEVGDTLYNVKGSYFKDGTVVLKLFNGEEFFYELKAVVGEDQLKGIPAESWHAEKEL